MALWPKSLETPDLADTESELGDTETLTLWGKNGVRFQGSNYTTYSMNFMSLDLNKKSLGLDAEELVPGWGAK